MANGRFDRRTLFRLGAYSSSAFFTAGVYRYFRPLESSLEGDRIDDDAVTAEAYYKNRKQFIKRSIYESVEDLQIDPKELTSYRSITSYNNFYEFSTNKSAVKREAANWKIKDWQLKVDGLVERPVTFNLDQIRRFSAEDRIYRFRCVEGWSMVIPWRGFSLAQILEQVRPTAEARYVSFESYYNEQDMPNAGSAGIPFPYVEGLRIDEALHPLTFLATGLYGRHMPNQNGAPIRLVVPWKYGFKSIKSIVHIRLTSEQPQTTWQSAAPNEYGFYSNVNPAVDHPRWSQKRERRIGENGLRETLMFNGYEKQVAHLYKDMDLRVNF